ncbi:MAG: DUF86 domain-containing protein [Thermoprotei archaeon]|nr:MAG: DUF86 domain-containing protein [Thermoprotei archaeon]
MGILVSIEKIKRLIREIEDSLAIAKDIVSMDYSSFIQDIRNRYTLRLALVEIVEAAASLGLYLLRELRNIKKVEGYFQIFRKLVEQGVLSPETGEEMEKLARLRNLIIHRYWEVDDSKIYREARDSGLKVIEKFVREVGTYVSRARNP